MSKLTGWAPSLDCYEPSLRLAAVSCSAFVRDMELGMPPYWITLQGVNGCGKTFLMRQVFEQAKRINPGNPANNRIWPPDWSDFPPDKVNVYSGRRPYCLRYDESSLASLMRAGDYGLPMTLRADYFVCLDEIGGTRDPTNFMSDAVTQLCEGRLNRWGMFATNLTLQEIAERMDARISSRMIRHENKFIAISAGDYALRG